MKLTTIHNHFSACDREWEDMPEQDGGRMCTACDKVLTDFTESTHDEILAAYKGKNKQERHCGRFTDDQVRVLTHHIGKEKSQSRIPWLVAMAMGAVSFTPLAIQAQTVPDSLQLDIPVVNVSIPGLPNSPKIPVLKEQKKIVVPLRFVYKENGEPYTSGMLVTVDGRDDGRYIKTNEDGYGEMELLESELKNPRKKLKLSFETHRVKAASVKVIPAEYMGENVMLVKVVRKRHVPVVWMGCPRF